MLSPLPTIAQAQEQMRAVRLSSTELVERCLDAIDRHDARIRAWMLVDRQAARAEAARLDEAVRGGQRTGPLHGIPVGIKDIIDVAGLPTRAGSTLTDESPATTDAPVVARLRAAGAIILGKTVTTEFACFDPAPTGNPWNLAHTPGGSSSGSAAAVAAGMCLAALGTQTGGSINRPASYCGVVGLKPTFGRLSMAGIFPVSGRLDHAGPLARCVDDALRVFDVIADEADARDAPAAATAPSSWRIGRIEEYFRDTADAPVWEACLRAGEWLEANGAQVERAPLPSGFARIHPMHRRLMEADAAANHRRWFPARRAQYGPKLAAMLDAGARVSAAEYDEALAHQDVCRREFADWAARYDALLAPATLMPAPADLTTTGDASFNAPFSYTGLPALSLPVALSSAGLPLAVQLVGPPRREARLAQIAALLEHSANLPHWPGF